MASSSSWAERIKRTIRVCRATLAGDESTTFAQQQVEYLGKTADAVIIFPYGFHAVAPADTLGLLFAQMGNPEALIRMPGFDRNRPTMVAGEVAVYHPGTGSVILFKADGSVSVTSVVGVNVSAPAVSITGNATITGNLTVTGITTLGTAVTSNGKNIGDTHTHVGSPTAPTGVQSNTGVPV